MKKIYLGLLLFILACCIFGVRISKRIEFKQEVSGHLKRAADASTIELAQQELSTVIAYLEKNNLTSGYTSVMWKTPDEDIEFWYKNLKASKAELSNLKSESALEKTNVLMKLRETLVDSGKKTKVTLPKGLHVFPHNKLWAALSFLATLLVISGFVLFAVGADERSKNKKASSAQ